MVHFECNRGYNRDTIALCEASYVSFNYDSQIHFLGNNAEHVGGAIFVQENCFLSGIAYCFYRIAFSNTGEEEFIGNIVFEGNVAKAGYDIYGGRVEDCYSSDPTITSKNNQFETLFGSLLALQVCYSRISSNPEPVQLCSNNGCPDSNAARYMVLHTYPGKRFDISVTIVGQAQGLVTGVVHPKKTSKTLQQVMKNQAARRLIPLSISLVTMETWNFLQLRGMRIPAL